VTQTDRATQIAGPGFDAAVWEVWPYLSAGASILIPDEETSASPKELRDWLASNAITLSFLPTSLAESVLCLEWPRDVALRVLLTGGDKLRCYPPPGLPFVLVNNYGPTESTVVAASGMVSPDAHADTPPSIGRPIANTQVYVLDAHLQPVPIGVAGELYIGGRSLARGYLNRPEMTAEHFIPNPFDREPGARLYRTGDLARYRPDGNIEFLGRADYQVKIRGFRIEVGEIEAVLGQHPGVRTAVVLARDDLPGGRGLVAYLVAEQERTPKGSALRGYLRERLPEYMVPAAFVFLDALPVTANGKLQRAKLPPPDPRSSELVEGFIAPESATELALAAIWAKLLGLERVGIHDSFFDLGGHSLLAAQVRSRIRDTFHIDLPLRTIFEMPTIAELSGLVDQIPSILGRVDSSAEDMIQERDEIDL
jgi:acyl-coenzyme A synthetase/AMP-(fatty) acid ligase/acyl carrier protein